MEAKYLMKSIPMDMSKKVLCRNVFPVLRASNKEYSSALDCILAASFDSRVCLSRTVVKDHFLNAVAAESMASFVFPASASTTVAISEPSAGLLRVAFSPS